MCKCLFVCVCVFPVLFWKQCLLFPSVTGPVEDSLCRHRNLRVCIFCCVFFLLCRSENFAQGFSDLDAAVVDLKRRARTLGETDGRLCETRQHVALLGKPRKKKLILCTADF